MWYENLLRFGKKCGEWTLLFYVTVDVAIASNIEKVTGIKEGNVGLLKTEHSENAEKFTINSSSVIFTVCMTIGFAFFCWGLFQLRKKEKTEGFVYIGVGGALAILALLFFVLTYLERNLLIK